MAMSGEIKCRTQFTVRSRTSVLNRTSDSVRCSTYCICLEATCQITLWNFFINISTSPFQITDILFENDVIVLLEIEGNIARMFSITEPRLLGNYLNIMIMRRSLLG